MSEKSDFIVVKHEIVKDNDIAPFNIYTLEYGNHLLFCTKSSEVKKRELSKTYLRGKKYFYIKKQDKKKLDNYTELHLGRILNNDVFTLKERSDLVYRISSIILHQIFSRKEAVKIGRINKFIVDTMTFMFAKKVNIFDIIDFERRDFQIYNHMLHCSIYAALFFPFIGINDPRIIHRVTIGAFLHDIGKSRIDPRLIIKPGLFNQEELIEMNKHPILGIEFLKNELKVDDPIIEAMILRHHERLDGSGFPNHTTDLKIYERAMAIIDMFDVLTYKQNKSKELSMQNAFMHIVEHEAGTIDVDLLKQFAYMLGVKLF